MTEEMNLDSIKVIEVGDIVTGIVTKIEDKQVLVSVNNSKLDGIIPISELASFHVETASEVVSLDQTLELEVMKIEEETFILSKKKVDANSAWKQLEESFTNKETITATVKEVVKGGLIVDLGVRGFIPASLVEKHFVDDLSVYQNVELPLKIVEMDASINRLVLSHRAYLEQEDMKKREDTIHSLQVGSILEGKVHRITEFGAFVDLGGIDGLVHISQIAHNKVSSVSDILEVGQTVKVKVMSVDRDNERISLSIKETLEGPWTNIEQKLPKGSIVTGTVTRITSFGAFVEVLPSIEGLVHISQISHKHINKVQEVLKVGQEVQVKVLEVSEEKQRLSLSIKELIENEEVFDYELPKEESGFQLGELFGDLFKKLEK